MSAIICYRTFMTQTNSFPKLAGKAGTLMALVGILIFMSAVFGFTPRTFLFVGVGIIVLSFVSFFLEEFGPGR